MGEFKHIHHHELNIVAKREKSKQFFENLFKEFIADMEKVRGKSLTFEKIDELRPIFFEIIREAIDT